MVVHSVEGAHSDRRQVNPPDALKQTKKIHGLTKREWVDVARLMLNRRYNRQGWIIYHELRNAVGYATKESIRAIDVFAMGVWGSTKYERKAFEIKTARSDFVKELRDTSKWMGWADHVHEFWFVTLPGVVKEGEIPERCGHMEIQKSRLVIKKHAPHQTPGPMPIKLLASILCRFAGPRQTYENAKYMKAVNVAGKWITPAQFDKLVGEEIASRRWHWQAEANRVVNDRVVDKPKLFKVGYDTVIPFSTAESIMRNVWSGLAEDAYRSLPKGSDPTAAAEAIAGVIGTWINLMAHGVEKARRTLRSVHHEVERAEEWLAGGKRGKTNMHSRRRRCRRSRRR